jgi:hypothetical protein
MAQMIACSDLPVLFLPVGVSDQAFEFFFFASVFFR